jgi:hypothetical protein
MIEERKFVGKYNFWTKIKEESTEKPAHRKKRNKREREKEATNLDSCFCWQ